MNQNARSVASSHLRAAGTTPRHALCHSWIGSTTGDAVRKRVGHGIDDRGRTLAPPRAALVVHRSTTRRAHPTRIAAEYGGDLATDRHAVHTLPCEVARGRLVAAIAPRE